ncbi:TetR/AcrR family transcriptional regulator [Amycolatopsis rhabdoformis]|uniref:TetR/AcrR family transcriptional regulator n=1 Tax=Amycolatopsis rhabdoformis TaxID=1448059 RepID=A0ABZ1IE41_9PSEU|nr:TetR/AcrR family transcriptional regulator [Amycolatopsis rhabdoformis]WSE31819.1 TetR/AcrR family transcriptional regulator [Amycolatopsis rhabdoformis]
MSPRTAAALRDGDRSLREHLIATAGALMAEEGAAKLTVRAIARRAGVADGVLYNHFADKEELLAHALREHVREAERDLGALPAPGSASVEANLRAHLTYGLALHQAILPTFAGLLTHPAVLARFAELTPTGDEWRDRLLAYLHAERDLGRLSPTTRPAAAAALLVGACHETVFSALVPHTASVATSVDELVATVLEGIS